ncbi:right-handed parallel beta-helix repeat-containing protein [Roseisolibacter sp. H3M3-2]|uniref:right-handed parallel beta-helix repeat-containing protein n=1 Tax=Roseisolibacter sp. H3M3-2 TaxID=3031323 RepID=UPI0023DA937C|nr:right-handed parallel beta-helix repeat-containing protein [Roseisolibacter sp. H3M3-2]MDF1503275.1 right-handed parallel beta-helix repeat-containing protein [Roseisolibacter sp. H3M3-2]
MRAYIAALALLSTVGACADQPTAPAPLAARAPSANVVADPNTVTNLNDAGIGSLRWVLHYADSGAVVRFDPALAGKTIVLDSAIKMYLTDVTIEGPRDRGITISSGGRSRILETWGRGPYTLRNVAVANGRGPAIFGGNHVTLENSTVYGITGGGAIAVFRATLRNSTVSGIQADSTYTPAVQASQKIEVINSTIAHNGRVAVGGTSSLVLRNAVLANNGGSNCNSPVDYITFEGTNLSDDDTCGGPAQIVIADPKLGPLGDNGGPTPTHAIGAGSPAVGVGTACSVAVDQRYVQRDAACDLGAYEFTDPTSVTLTVDPGVAVSQANGWATVTGTIRCSRAESFDVAVQLSQEQKAGRSTATVHAARTVPVACSTTARPWSASMVLTDGAFSNGGAVVAAQTLGAAPWVTPATAGGTVKLYWARK